MSSRVVQWRGCSSCRRDAEAGSAALSATSRHWLARSARKRRGTTSGRRPRSQAWNSRSKQLTRVTHSTLRFRISLEWRDDQTLQTVSSRRAHHGAWSMSPRRRVRIKLLLWVAKLGAGRHWVLHVHACTASALACARAAHRARCTLHAPLSRNSPPHLSHAPLPRASPTRLSHAPSTRLSHVPRSGGAGQAAQLQ